MIKYKEGNLLDMFDKGDFNIIMHQCNCFYLGAGIADQICKRFGVPRTISGFPLDRYGSYDINYYNKKEIINLYSQFQGGPCTPFGIDSYEVRLKHLELALILFKSDLLDRMNRKDFVPKVGIPLIGSGIAADPAKKGDSGDLEYFIKHVQPIFQKVFLNDEIIDITVVTYKP